MSKELALQEKLRRSEALTEDDIYKDFMVYAQEVRDQLDIYLYMEENQIGTDMAEYWLVRFKVMRSLCSLISLVQLTYKVKALPDIEIYKIDRFQHDLYLEFQKMIYGNVRGKRQASVFRPDSLSLERIHPETRMIGNIEVYIDDPYRRHYYLQDYAKFIEEEMRDFCNIEREEYIRQRTRKPLSFLAKKEQHLIELAEQFLSKNGRRSLNVRSSYKQTRFSNQIHNIKKDALNEEDYHTPKNNQAAKSTSEKLKTTTKSNRSRDSIEILKEMRQKMSDLPKSPKFKYHQERDQTRSCLDQCLPIEQRCRFNEDEDDFCFSFGKKSEVLSEIKPKERKRCDSVDESKDNAFVLYSFSQDSKSLDDGSTSTIKKEDFDLELLIQEIQQESHQKLNSRTISSSFHSNQQDKDSLGNALVRQCSQLNYKSFEALLDTESNLGKQDQSIKLEQLIQFDDDKNPEIPATDSKDQTWQSGQKRKSSQLSFFCSEPRRLSNISEQASFFSESKQKYSKRRGHL